MLIKLKPDWSNWRIYEDATMQYLRSKGLGGHIMFAAESPKIGAADSPQRQVFIQHLANDGTAVLVLIETLPAAIYEQIVDDPMFSRKWGKLRRLYKAFSERNSSGGVVGKVNVNVKGDTAAAAVVALGVDMDGVGEPYLGAGDGAGESSSIASDSPVYTEEQSVIMDQLKRFPAFTTTPTGASAAAAATSSSTPLFIHLTMLKVLREALVSRDVVISDLEFLEYVAGSFAADSQYGGYVKAVVGRMKTREKRDVSSGVGDGAGVAVQKSEVGEVFEMLLELEKLSRDIG